jgi:two-component system heavy metal sensor histidine kinase CusS
MFSKLADGPYGRWMRPPRGATSLAIRITVWYASSTFALVATVTGFLYWFLVKNLDSEADRLLAESLHGLEIVLRTTPQDGEALRNEMSWEWSQDPHARVFARVLDERGAVVAETPGMLATGLVQSVFPAPRAADPGTAPGIDLHFARDHWYRGFARNLIAAGGERRTIQVAVDRKLARRVLAQYRERLWFALGLALLSSVVGGYGLARRGLKPVSDIADTMERIRFSTLHERIDTEGLPTELSNLAATFNEMLDRLEETFNRLSRFSADMAHELRTPVNNLRGALDVTLVLPRSADEYRQAMESSLEECIRLSRLIDNLLFLARAENPQAAIDKKPLRLGREIAAIADFYEAAASEAGITLTASAAEDLEASIDRNLFQRALANLVENSLAHTPRGGRITLAASRSASGVRVDVSDDGCGIPAIHLPRVFDRLYRVSRTGYDASRGAGLGLSMVKSVMSLHGGSVEIASELGRGTCVSLFLPREPGAAGPAAAKRPAEAGASQITAL